MNKNNLVNKFMKYFQAKYNWNSKSSNL